MSAIHVLAPHVADLIAAGEVVERPASAVKELVENAIDAGATAVTAESSGGGARLLRVTDNGAGMASDDAERAFLRHATSKIRAAEDLAAIRTLGFRGEALAAIAAVSRIQLITRARGAALGVSLVLEAGEITERNETGCPEGTTVVVRDLFYNTPARQKFLKKDMTESAHIQAVVQRAALSHPEISFQYIRDGRAALHTPGDGKLRSCLYSVFGGTFAAGLCEVPPCEHQGVRVRGFVSRPEAAQGNRLAQYVLLDGRPVRARAVTAALEEAYKNAVTAGRYPACVLHIELPPSDYDVNVHPAKAEVKFARERDVFDAVYWAARGALEGLSRPEWSPARAEAAPREAFHGTAVPQPDTWVTGDSAQSAMRKAQISLAPTTGFAAPSELNTGSLPVRQSALGGYEASPAAPDAAIPAREPPPPFERPWRLAGEALGGYLLVEEDDGLILIDKHAAHERVLYNRLKSEKREAVSQRLLSPVVVTLPPEAHALLLSRTELLTGMGFGLEDFGDGSLMVREAPADVDTGALPGLLGEIAERLREGRRDPAPDLFDDILHMVACKAAVKLGKRSSAGEAEALAALVMNDPSVRHCPHGRPVAVRLSRADIERQFKRQ